MAYLPQIQPREGLISNLAAGLLNDWGEGRISSTQLQGHMAAARSDGLQHPMVHRLANVAAGAHSHSSLLQVLEAHGILGLLTPMESGLLSHVILPSDIVSMLLADFPSQFRSRLGAEPEKVRSFWRDFLARPQTQQWAAAHPFLAGKSVADLVCTIPCTVHVDAGPITKRKSATCLSWTSLIGSGSEKGSQFLIGTHIKGEHDADHDAWRAVLSDFDAMASGIVNGREVAREGRRLWKFVLLIAKADEEARCNTFGLPHYGAAQPCPECLADRAVGGRGMPFTDLRAEAAWRASESMSFATYRSRIRQPLHPLAASPYCCSKFFFFPDLMHLMDCHGVAGIFMGSAIATLMTKPALGANKRLRLKAINDHRAAWYRANPTTSKLPALIPSSLILDGWAELTGNAVKSAATRHAVPWCRDLCREQLTSGSVEDQLIIQMADDLVQLYAILYGAGRFLSDRESRQLQDVCLRFGRAFQQMRQHCLVRNELRFNVKPKVHKMQHLPMISAVLNPRYVQVYGEESLIGTTTKIWARCVAGPHHRTAQKSVLAKRVVALLLHLHAAE